MMDLGTKGIETGDFDWEFNFEKIFLEEYRHSLQYNVTNQNTMHILVFGIRIEKEKVFYFVLNRCKSCPEISFSFNSPLGLSLF